MDTAFSVSSSSLQLKFDLDVVNAQMTGGVQPKFLNDTTDQASILFGINVYTSNSWARLFAAAPTSSGGGVFAVRNPANTSLTTFGNYVNGTTYEITLDVDYTTGLVNAYINGTLAASDIPFWATGVAAPVTTQEVFMYLNGDTDERPNQVAIDNIQASAPVPEPGSIVALLGLGGMGLLLALRRRHSAN